MSRPPARDGGVTECIFRSGRADQPPGGALRATVLPITGRLAGAVVVIPAGVGHKGIEASPDLGIMGAYPA